MLPSQVFGRDINSRFFVRHPPHMYPHVYLTLVSEPNPQKIEKEDLVNRLGWNGSVHCARYAGALPIGFWLAFSCALIRNTNRTRAVFAFCFVLERCETKWVRSKRFCACLVFRTLYWPRKIIQLIKFLTFHSVRFHPSRFTRPSFRFFEGLVPRLGEGGELVKKRIFS